MSVDPVSLAIEAALMAANMALTASQTFEGPRLDNLHVATADFGAPLNYVKGRRRISGVSCIFAEPLKEVKTQNKTKGGKYNEYRYYGTWAVVVCDHPVEAVTRIWFDKQLVYDATGAGPVTPLGGAVASAVSAVTGSKGSQNYLRIYLGDEDQEPDPRMSATLDGEFGEGSTPAFRGVAYVMFEEVPLEKFGNRFPLVEVEVVTLATTALPYTTVSVPITQPFRMFGAAFSPDGTRFIWGSAGEYAIYDAATKAPIVSGLLSENYGDIGLAPVLGISQDGLIYATEAGGYLVRFAPDGTGPAILVTTLAEGGSGVNVVQGEAEWACVDGAFSLLQYHQINGILNNLTVVDPEDYFPGGFHPNAFFADSYGCLWAIGTPIAITISSFYLIKLEGADGAPECLFKAEITIPASAGSFEHEANAYHYADADVDHFVVQVDGKLFTIDRATLSITSTRTGVTMDVYNLPKQFRNVLPGAGSIWLNGQEISSKDLSTLRTVNVLDWKVEDADGMIYDRLNHALICAPQFTQVLTWRYLDRVGGEGVVLGDIVSDIAQRCGLDPDEFDATALDQTVTGYSWTQGSGKAILSPLLEVYDSYARPHDFTLEFLKRGAVAAGTIATADMGAGGDTRYTVTTTLDSDLPRRITFTFADPAMDQQPNSVPVQRPGGTMDSSREQALDATTLVLDVDFGRRTADRYLRRQWFEAEQTETALSRIWTKLEPGDVYTLTLDDASRTAQLQSIEFGANGVLSTKWNRDALGLHALSGAAGQPADGYDPHTIPVVGYTKGFVLDTPLVTDADDGLILYLAAAPYGDVTWPGAVFYEGVDGTTFPTLFDGVASDREATWGTCDDALPDAAPEVWDRGSSIQVTMRTGTLTSATEAAVENGANRALIGEEIVGFRDAELIGDGVYQLTGFLRGRRGTERATGDHAIGDRFLLLSNLTRHVMGASDLGVPAYYKAVTAGGLETAGFAQALTYSGASAKPYSPAHFEAILDAGTGDWTFTWVRRTRIGGAWRDLEDASLGEGSESYDLVILDGDSEARVINVSSPTATYTAAQQTTDFGAPQTTLDAAVYQRSTTVGRGFGATASFEG